MSRLAGAIGVHGNRRSWPEVPLHAVLSRVREQGRPELPLLGVSVAEGVRERWAEDGRPAASLDLSGYNVVRPGQIVMNALGKPHGSIGASDVPGITSPAYWVLDVNSELADSRYLHHLLRSTHMVNEYQRLGKNMPPNQFDIPWETFRSVHVALPPLDVQRRVADFLDDQVTRIDDIIAARQEQVALGVAQHLAWLSDEYESLSAEWGAAPLRYFLMSIGQGWSPQCDDRPPSESEWGVLRAGACNGGVFHPDDRKTLQEGLAPRLEYEVKTGDLLVNRASGSLELIGNATVVGDDLQPRTLLCDKIYRLTLGNQLLPHFVSSMWPAPPVRESLLLGVSGADGMANSLPSEAIKAVRIPAAPIHAQRAWLDGFQAQREAQGTLDREGNRSIELLQELKRSLISAAVSGEFDVTAADGSGVRV